MHNSLRSAALALVAACLLLPAAGAGASALDDAKAAGLVGERPDGYVGLVVASAPAATQALVTDINARRRAHYQEIASKNGTTIEAVSHVAGSKLIARASPGQWIMNAQGSWVKK